MPRGNPRNLLDPPPSDEPSSLGERLEPPLQRQSHTFEETPMNHIGERMPVQNSTKIRREPQSPGDLSQTSEEYFRARQLRFRRQILRITRIANDCIGRDSPQ